jgi:tRNA/rRNA methyltransferase/tRNA (cytidine32/uridine32-2'-O)-methyltransferase
MALEHRWLAVMNSISGGAEAAFTAASDALHFVLVGTTHPGNIGASARAMKAMGFTQMTLVSPKTVPAAAATAMASGADDVLAKAKVLSSLGLAVSKCALVIGTTARDRHLQWPVLSPAEAGIRIREALSEGPVAVVFGREQAGLSNAELDLCHHAVRIPSDPAFSSLNLAQAVQVCAYEFRQALMRTDNGDAVVKADERDRLATTAELDQLHAHLIEMMTAVGYFDPSNPRLLERRLRRLINRASMRQSEAQILRGFMSAIAARLGGAADA